MKIKIEEILQQNNELITRIDERQKKVLDELKEHNIKIEKLNDVCIELQVSMKNHINLHKRDIAIIGLVLGGVTLLLNVLFFIAGGG